MAFDRDDYNENIIYCEFVYNYAIEKGVELYPFEIQTIANLYASELYESNMYDSDELVVDRALLNIIIKLYLKNLRTNFSKDIVDEDYVASEADYYSNGGYNQIDDSYDDLSYEDINDIVNKVYGRK